MADLTRHEVLMDERARHVAVLTMVRDFVDLGVTPAQVMDMARQALEPGEEDEDDGV